MKMLLFAALTITAASILSSCSQDGQSINGPGTVLPLKSSPPPPPPANPVITYTTSVTSHGKSTFPIAVMNADGTNQTIIYTPASGYRVSNPTWSPKGGSIAFSLEDYSAGSSAIMAIDISVNSSGVPVGSNLRTIVAWPASDSEGVFSNLTASGPSWCQQSATGKIAFILSHTNKVGSEKNAEDLCTVPDGGGTVTVLATRTPNGSNTGVGDLLYWPTWGPDDSHIAARVYAGGPDPVLVFDMTGAVTDSTPIASTSVNQGIRWSHSGTNEIVISSAGSNPMYYLTPGSTPTSENISGQNLTWSPNNSVIMYTESGALKTVAPNTPTTTTVLSSFSGGSLDWRQAN